MIHCQSTWVQMTRSMVVVQPTFVKITFDTYILSCVFISKSIFTWDLREAGLQFGLSESEIFCSCALLKAHQELPALFCFQQMYIHLLLTMETLQVLPLSLCSQRLFKVKQWAVSSGRLLIEGLIKHVLLYRNGIGSSEILFILQCNAKNSHFPHLGNKITFQTEMQKNNFIKTYPFYFWEHVRH